LQADAQNIPDLKQSEVNIIRAQGQSRPYKIYDFMTSIFNLHLLGLCMFFLEILQFITLISIIAFPLFIRFDVNVGAATAKYN
jgi:hypothetical protein